MKKSLLFSLSAVAILTASSFTYLMDCSGFDQFIKGTKYTTTMYDDKGKVTSAVNCTTTDVTVTEANSTATINAIIVDKEGKPTDTIDYSLVCNGKSFYMDIKSMAAAVASQNPQAKNMQISVEGEMLDYPVVMTAGQSLPNGKTILKMSQNGTVMSTTTLLIKDRKCEKIEDKTTSAGTWSCYKITYVTEGTMDLGMMKMPLPSRRCVEWFSFKVGPVRTENYGKNEKLEGYTELTKFTKPL